MSLGRFEEPITIGEREIKSGYPTYRMDERKNPAADDMKRAAGLGSCNCCDYVVITKEKIILIEDTNLIGQVQRLREEHAYLNEENKKTHISNCIRDENRLKVYGAMLILCRLAGKCLKVAEILNEKKYQFLLVPHKIKSGDDERAFDNIKDSLRNSLKGAIGKALFTDTEVLPIEQLEDKLRAPSP